MAEQPIGPILDGLGVVIDLADGDLIESAVVLAKVINADGETTLSVSSSAGLSWIGKIGLVVAGSDLVRRGGYDEVDTTEE